MIKFYEHEYQPLDELSHFRDHIRNEYSKFKANLLERKEQLLMQDVSQWGFVGDHKLDPDLMERLTTKDQAFEYMLTADTARLHELSEEFNFFTNQCYEEVRRIGKNNGDSLVDHFMESAQK